MSTIAALRETAQSEFAKAGYPTTRNEEWKFTNVAPIAEAPFTAAKSVEPALAVLDETGSGLDIDALKVVANGVNALRSPERAMVIVTHYQRLLDYIKPDRVHVLAAGRIAASGGPELAHELERDGYDKYARAA